MENGKNKTRNQADARIADSYTSSQQTVYSN